MTVTAHWTLAQVISFGHDHGLPVDDARVLHHYNSTVVLLPAADIVVRVTDGAAALDHIRTTQAICSWLIGVGFPATEPAEMSPAIMAGSMVASFWRYHHPPTKPLPLDSRDLATLLRQLHSIGTRPPVDLPPWRPLASLNRVLDTEQAERALTSAEHTWLHEEIRTVQRELAEIEWPLGHGLIHGDAWAGNLLAEQQQKTTLVRLGDWDNVAAGPREIDLVPSWHASYRYGKGPAWRRSFADVYGYDLETWSGFSLLMRMRDLVQLTGPIRRAADGNAYATALAQRLGDIRRGVRDTVWTAL